jgi:hypothetical protein
VYSIYAKNIPNMGYPYARPPYEVNSIYAKNIPKEATKLVLKKIIRGEAGALTASSVYQELLAAR